MSSEAESWLSASLYTAVQSTAQKKTFREGGVPIFFRGIKFSLIRAAPVAACVLPTYDLMYKVAADLTKDWKDLDT